MRQKFIIGNWKMYATTADAGKLAKAIVDGMNFDNRVTVVVCLPFPYLGLVGNIFKDSHIAIGAQNLFPEKAGAFTGEVSPTMLLDLGCKYVILGHSERRQILGESDTFINQKVKIALASGLNVILCVGETLGERNAQQTETVLARQLNNGLADLSADLLTHISIAYEPVWAIGNQGHQATPQQAHKTHAFIRHYFCQMFGEPAGQTLIIHYGGSVNPENAAALFSEQGIDGVLIGADSLNANQFLAIIHAGNSNSESIARGESLCLQTQH